MPTTDDYTQLRRMTGEMDEASYDNTTLDAYITAAGSLEAAAAKIWGEKASAYADLVNMSEAGSSRSNSDLFKHAQEQRVYYENLVPGAITAPVTGSTTRPIKRA